MTQQEYIIFQQVHYDSIYIDTQVHCGTVQTLLQSIHYDTVCTLWLTEYIYDSEYMTLSTHYY